MSLSGTEPLSPEAGDRRRGSFVFLTLVCASIMILEGVDIQVLGIAAPLLMPELGISPADAGIIFAMTQVGGVAGAFLGGRYSDLWGRRNVLFLSVLVFSVFTLATVLAYDFASLLVIRTLTGAGIGAALPNVIGIMFEAAPERHRVKAVTLVLAGMPLGGACIALLASVAIAGLGWQGLFYIGGVLPLLVAPLLFLVPNRRPKAAPGEAVPSGMKPLFDGGRGVTTLLIWAIFFVTAGMVYMMLNWLPILVTALGYEVTAAHAAALYFNVASVLGALTMGYSVDRFGSRVTLPICYVGFLFGILGMMFAPSLAWLMASVAVVGFFLLGAQFSLNGVIPVFYPAVVRGLGTGAALAVGRVGSILAPLATGWILQAGGGSIGVITAMAPAVVFGVVAVSALMSRRSVASGTPQG